MGPPGTAGGAEKGAEASAAAVAAVAEGEAGGGAWAPRITEEGECIARSCRICVERRIVLSA